jgi:hypothetical protein
LERVFIAAIVAESALAACRDFVREFVLAIPASVNPRNLVSPEQQEEQRDPDASEEKDSKDAQPDGCRQTA